jgi:hypothetical protein
VADDDIWHAARNVTRKIEMDEDLIMLIGPAQDGTPRWPASLALWSSGLSQIR